MTDVRDEKTEVVSAPASAASPGDLLASGTVLPGGWRVDSLLAHGGMGAVYLAHDETLDRKVAIKVLTHALAQEPGALARFEREARLMAKLDHPNLVPVYSTGHVGDRPFLVMKHLEGMTLRDYLRELGAPCPPSEILPLMEQLCDGLGYIHAQGFVHRDIKPSNLFLSPSGQLTLLDFGILREAASRELTQSGVAVGTPSYMSPEQATGRGTLDARSDLYSVGLVLEELLLGFNARALRSSVSTPNSTPAAVNSPMAAIPEAPAAWRGVLERALAWNPAERFRSAAELLEAIRHAAQSPGQLAVRVSPRARRRRGWALAVGAGAMVVLAGGIAWEQRHRPSVTPPAPRASPPTLAAPAPASATVVVDQTHAPPLASSSGPVKETSAPAPAHSQDATAHRPRPARANARGTLRVVTVQGHNMAWANVTLDGEPQGATPLDLSVTPGLHRIRVERPGFRPVQRAVTVNAGRPTVVSLELRP